MDNGVGLSDLDIAVSRLGAQEYVANLKLEVIDQAIEVMKDTAQLYDAFRRNWVGSAESAFEQNFNNGIEQIAQALEMVKQGIDGTVGGIYNDLDDFDVHIAQSIRGDELNE